MIVKVCGVRTAAVAEVAIDAGADWLGVVLVPASPRHADDGAARAVAAAARGRADLVGVLVSPTLAECEDAALRYGLAAVQVHGPASPSLSWASPVPVIRGMNVNSAAGAFLDDWWPDCLVLVDAAPAAGGNGLPGGTGQRVDEATAAALARHRRVILAGGLTPANVAAAIAAVRPEGVDASSGLESSPGVKDPVLVAAFVLAARAAAGDDP